MIDFSRYEYLKSIIIFSKLVVKKRIFTLRTPLKTSLCTLTYISIGPLQDPLTWYKITYTGEQVAQWDFQNKGMYMVLEVPLCILLASICNFVPCDRVLQRAYSAEHIYHFMCKLLKIGILTLLMWNCPTYKKLHCT